MQEKIQTKEKIFHNKDKLQKNFINIFFNYKLWNHPFRYIKIMNLKTL